MIGNVLGLPRARARMALAAAVVLVAALAWTADAAALQPRGGVPGNLIANPGAEDDLGLVGWEGDGFRQATYGDSAVVPPLEFGLSNNYRATLFAARSAGATLTQRIDLTNPGRVRLIDGGNQNVVFGGAFGGQGGREDTTRLVVAPLDERGDPIGPARIIGGPTDADRRRRTTLLDCASRFVMPRYVRYVQVSLLATGTADGSSTAAADGLYFTLGQYAFTVGPPIPTPGCVGPQAAVPAVTRPPRITSVVRLPALRRCRRPRLLTFRVQNQWSLKVARLIVRARGKRTTFLGGELALPLRIPGPKRTMRVRVTTVLFDGRVASRVLRYRACGR